MTDAGPRLAPDAPRSRGGDRARPPAAAAGDRLYDLGFFLVEAFAALEVTAVLVANARITEGLGLREELSSYVVNSYLYPLFAGMALLLAASGALRRRARPVPLFLGGLGTFTLGNALCVVAGGPRAFFAGRVVTGLGGALAFAGQLWTLSAHHRRRMAGTLVWGEAGAAVGVLAGPLVGGLFAASGPQGWRGFFVLNGALGIATAAFAWAGLRGRPAELEPAAAVASPEDGRARARAMTLWQVAVSILVVGAEYLFSDVLQARMGKGPLFVGGMTVLASVGAIAGSAWAARREARLAALPPWTVAGLLASLAVLALALELRAFLLAAAPILAAGACMGVASVAIYASIVRASAPSQFLTRSIVYLLGMQVGNAAGVQAVGVAEALHLGVPSTAALLAAVPAALAAGLLLRSGSAS